MRKGWSSGLSISDRATDADIDRRRVATFVGFVHARSIRPVPGEVGLQETPSLPIEFEFAENAFAVEEGAGLEILIAPSLGKDGSVVAELPNLVHISLARARFDYISVIACSKINGLPLLRRGVVAEARRFIRQA